jgi:hypothetical protein
VYTSAHSERGGLLKGFVGADYDIKTLRSLLDFLVNNRLVMLAVEGYFLQSIVDFIIENYEFATASHEINIYNVGQPRMLVDGSNHNISLAIVSAHTSGPNKKTSSIKMPLERIEPRLDMSGNVKNWQIVSDQNRIMIKIKPYDSSSMVIWCGLELDEPIDLREFPIMVISSNGTRGTFMNVGFGSSDDMKTCIGERGLSPNRALLFFDLRYDLKNPGLGTYKYLYLAFSGWGSESYIYTVYSLQFSDSYIIKQL